MKRYVNPACCQVKDCPQKYEIVSCQYFNRGMPGEIIEIEKIAELGIDEIAWILSFLPLEKIMCLRRVNMTWREAATKTIVPPTEFWVEDMKKYRAMRVMARVLPNLQQITISDIEFRHKYNDGEDPVESEAARTADWTSLDIGIISIFSKLRVLDIHHTGLNGRYPFLFNSFPLIQKLSIRNCYILKWDLDMLAGFPTLKVLECRFNYHLNGNINSLRVLKDTLEKVTISNCDVEGNFMDLADFPHLKKLNLYETAVTGDIRDIGESDFSSLEELILPNGVYGGDGYEFQRISDGPDLIRAVFFLTNQRPELKMMIGDWRWKLSEDSPDWYESADGNEDGETPPFYIYFVEAGPRLGYRWEAFRSDTQTYPNPCEVNWLDPEPESGSTGYEDYVADYRRIQGEISLYRGYYEPPTEEQYTLLYEEYLAEIQDDEEMNY
jgi:hypothetical protein